ncbi:MAG: 4-phosphoerythronate dehydrogenase [Bacteroidales bacterium]|nr:4-phosphoerythronate dehydrogenase [Bacteroidales bacterium]
MKIVCDDKIPFLRGVFEPYAEVVYLPGAAITSSDVRDADALVTRTRTRCDSALLEGSSVRVIASATIGYDHIDTAWCSEHRIEWANAPGCNSGSVAQYISSVLVVLASRFDLDLGNMTLGIVGVGHVGSKVARVAQALGMRVLLNDPPRALAEGSDGFVSLEELIAGSDIIMLHVPLSDSTRYLFDAARIGIMRPDQILINTSRGEVVCGDALKEALRNGLLKAAVLDVWEHEPDIDPELAALVEIATPHIAGYSLDGKAAGTTAAVRVVARALGINELTDWSANLPPAAGNDTYDVTRDSDALKSDLSFFEHLRETYPVRREPSIL